jgi:hypothetical protein
LLLVICESEWLFWTLRFAGRSKYPSGVYAHAAQCGDSSPISFHPNDYPQHDHQIHTFSTTRTLFLPTENHHHVFRIAHFDRVLQLLFLRRPTKRSLAGCPYHPRLELPPLRRQRLSIQRSCSGRFRWHLHSDHKAEDKQKQREWRHLLVEGAILTIQSPQEVVSHAHTHSPLLVRRTCSHGELIQALCIEPCTKKPSKA